MCAAAYMDAESYIRQVSPVFILARHLFAFDFTISCVFGSRTAKEKADKSPRDPSIPGAPTFLVLGLSAIVRAGALGRARIYKALTASSTCSTWPATFTLRNTLRTTPSGPITNVERSMPMYFLP